MTPAERAVKLMTVIPDAEGSPEAIVVKSKPLLEACNSYPLG